MVNRFDIPQREKEKEVMTISEEGLTLIKDFESLHDGDLTLIGLQPKMCPAGIWTEGYGHAMQDPDTGRFLAGEGDKHKAYSLSTIKNEEQAERVLMEDVAMFEAFITRTGIELTQGQFDALVSFTFNLGSGAFTIEDSTLRRKVQNNPIDKGSVLVTEQHLIDYFERASFNVIHYNFIRWCKCDGEPLPGLIRRRDAEYALYAK